MVDTNKIKGRMAEKGITMQSLAPKIGYTAYTLGKMISNKTAMNVEVSKNIANELGIAKDEIVNFFYK